MSAEESTPSTDRTDHAVADPHVSAPASAPHRSSGRYVLWLLPVLLFGVAGYLFWERKIFLKWGDNKAGSSSKEDWLAQAAQARRRSPLEQFDTENLTIPRHRVVAGGPPKDGIPALTNPLLIPASQADYLRPKDRVIGVFLGKEARAYPLKIMNWHEAVNDTVGGIPLLVTYCPLCDSAAVFDRRTSKGVREFGISGLLYNSNVLLYDRNKNGKESLWTQMGAVALSGPAVNAPLKTLPVELTTWADWSSRHPETKVLSPKTGHRRNYARNPYAGYFSSPRLMFGVEPRSNKLPPKMPVLGVWTEKSARAYPLSAFRQYTAVQRWEQQIDGRKFTLVYEPAARTLRIESAGKDLQFVYAFWFAWYAFHPETEVIGEKMLPQQNKPPSSPSPDGKAVPAPRPHSGR